MIVGVTGHQDLGAPHEVAWVRRALTEQVAGCAPTSGLTSLAAGADQVFAEALVASRIPLDVVVPCAGYEDAFTDRDARGRYESLLARARRVVRLAYPAPSEKAYFAAGQYVVTHCDVLLAVWNGLPARGLGGTGDVVGFAVASRRPWIHIDSQRRVIRDHRGPE